jgi:HEAT repeat protein
VTHDQLLAALIQSPNEAADDALLEALRLGTPTEQERALGALLKRQTTHGLSGVIGLFDTLPAPLQAMLMGNLRTLHHAIRESGRSDQPQRRLAAMKLIAIGRIGKLAYVLSENLHEPEPTLAKAAVDAMVALARWVATESRSLQRGPRVADKSDDGATTERQAAAEAVAAEAVYRQLMEQRPEIEQTVVRALDGHRGKHGAELLRAALLLADSPISKTLAILQSSKHGGHSIMSRRLQQPPASEHVEAFLLGASHGGLRSHFAVAFSHIEEAPVLDALLRKTHWLKDQGLSSALRGVSRGVWWGAGDLNRDLTRRTAADAARIGNWLVVSGAPEAAVDEQLTVINGQCQEDVGARLGLLRAAAARPRGTSTAFLKQMLGDADERLARLAARELVRRRLPDVESVLLSAMSGAAPSVRRVIGRAVGQSGFEQYWNNFDRLQPPVRKSAGKAMLKLLPDAAGRLGRRLAAPAQAEQRLKAMQIVQELQLALDQKDRLLSLCGDPNPKLRSKAITVLGEVQSIGPQALVEKLLNDTDPRVRANMVEALESAPDPAFVPLLVQRARMGTNRERANAIKVLHRLRMNVFDAALALMLADPRPEHRISAMWALKATSWWNRLSDVGQMAKADPHLRVRRYAVALLQTVSQMVKAQRAKVAG